MRICIECTQIARFSAVAAAIFYCSRKISGTKKEHKPKLLSQDILRWWGRGLPHEGIGAEKFGMSLETRKIKHFWRDIPGFCRKVILGAPEKFEKKEFMFDSRPLKTRDVFQRAAEGGGKLRGVENIP